MENFTILGKKEIQVTEKIPKLIKHCGWIVTLSGKVIKEKE